MPNFVSGVKVGSLPITDANKHLVESSYVARTEKELPVLVRYFPKGKIEIPDATYLDLILYRYVDGSRSKIFTPQQGPN